jgi:hypothetical protein
MGPGPLLQGRVSAIRMLETLPATASVRTDTDNS